MAVSHNPTKTRTIEKAWFSEINKRWTEFDRRTISRFKEMNAPINNELIENAEVGMSAAQLRIYMAYVNEQIALLLLGNNPPLNWQNQYQLDSYVRGLERTRQSLIAQGAELVPTVKEQLASQGLASFTAKSSLTTSIASMAPIHQEGLEFLFTRAYESLNGWTDNLSKEIRQITFNAIRNGDGITETTKLIRERTGVSKSRAQLIARTETNQAYSEASLAETDRASEELGEQIDSRWITARDSRVRHSHAAVHGVVMDSKRARSIKSTSGYNCRCSLIPVIDGASNTQSQEDKFKAERKSLMKAEAKST